MSKKQLQHLGFVSNGIFLVQRDGEYFGPSFYLRLHEGLMGRQLGPILQGDGNERIHRHRFVNQRDREKRRLDRFDEYARIEP